MSNESPIILEVNSEYEITQRLDIWLSQQMQDFSRSHIQKLISQGNVKVNNNFCTSKKATLQKGDKIIVTIPPPIPLAIKANNLPLDILYEDDALLIINKPAGLVVHPAPGHSEGTLVNALLAHCKSLAGIGGVQRPGIVHRLDKDTTGAIMVAKTDQAYQHLQGQLQAKTARREYLGVVYGSPKTDSGIIDLPIGRHRLDRKKMAVTPMERGGKIAVTHWKVKERLGNFSMMLFRLETGRTHQIRVHSTQIGYPIVGDTIYGKGRSVGVNLTGQALHAWRLELQHPVSGELVEAIAPLPEDFLTLVEVLRRRFGLS